MLMLNRDNQLKALRLRDFVYMTETMWRKMLHMSAVTKLKLIYIITKHFHNSYSVPSARIDIKDPPVSKLSFLSSFEGWIM